MPVPIYRRGASALMAVALVVLSLLSACSPITALNTLLVPSEGWSATRGLAYGEDERQKLDVYTPDDAPRPAAVVVWFYGGSWRGGRRAYYRFVGEALTSRGYVVVIPDYRVYPDVVFPAFVEDGARALAWVQANIARYGGDPGRLLLMGHSAGAHIAAMLAVEPRYLQAAGVKRDRLRAFVGLAGPYAFNPLRYRTTRPVFEAAEPSQTMPIDRLRQGDPPPPMLLMHGADDGTVYPVNAHALADRVRRAGGQAEAIEYPGMGHIGIVLALARPLRGDGAVLDDADRFFRAHAGGASTAADDTLAGASVR